MRALRDSERRTEPAAVLADIVASLERFVRNRYEVLARVKASYNNDIFEVYEVEVWVVASTYSRISDEHGQAPESRNSSSRQRSIFTTSMHYLCDN
jgi:hypothetical protein